MYKEILVIEDYCKKNGVKIKKKKLFDGYVLRFNNGGDVAQHGGTYGSNQGCVEFGFTGFSFIDFNACNIQEALSFIELHKDELNKKEA
jgi:hypothetical protein